MKNLPKIELHCHLDGSLRPSTVLELALKSDLISPSTSLSDITELLCAPANCDSLGTYLERFQLPIAIMQTKEALYRVAYELMADAAAENVKYIEIRFAPAQHLKLGLTQREVIESVLAGMKYGSQCHDIQGNLILSYLRHMHPEEMTHMIDAGSDFLGQGVVAVDLCAGELDLFSKRFITPVAYAKQLGYNITIHAGETGISENVIEAITLLNAERIGHGVAIVNDPTAYALVKNNQITLECCPTSNVQTKSVPTIKDHPIDAFTQDDLLVTINTDNRTVSQTTMSDEYVLLTENFGWSTDHFMSVYKTAISASFASIEVQNWLRTFM